MPFAPGAYMNDGLFDFVLMLGGQPRAKDFMTTVKRVIADDG